MGVLTASVLVVDDEPLARKMLRLILVRAGFEVLEAQDGAEALAQIAERLPELVLLDIMMPGMDGYVVCQKLKADRRTAGVPVIMLSARADAQSIRKGLEVGATRYLTKPVMPQEVIRHVRETLHISDEISL